MSVSTLWLYRQGGQGLDRKGQPDKSNYRDTLHIKITQAGKLSRQTTQHVNDKLEHKEELNNTGNNI
jgi:hypothetical protein